ncbi:MAG: zinc-binding dehydrogenase [Microthrixaceae bacterium]
MNAHVARSMNAAVTVGHGGPEMIELREVPVPALGPGDALVRVGAAALNNTDIWTREGRYGSAEDPDAVAGWQGVPLGFPRIQGMDIAGEVVEVGDDVSNAWVGRRVIVDPTVTYADGFPAVLVGSEVDGGFAGFHRCSEAQLSDVTDSPLSDAQLSCLPIAYGTALGMINRAGCSPGERVLVTGASGGVGLAAVQLLLARSCRVVARTSEPHRATFEALGVEVSVRGVDDVADLDVVDAVVDVVGGDTFALLVDRLEVGGRLVVAGAIAGPQVSIDLRQLYLKQRTLIGSTMHTRDDFAQLARIATEGSLDPVVAQTYPLADLAAAQERFLAGDFVGKLVIEPNRA